MVSQRVFALLNIASFVGCVFVNYRIGDEKIREVGYVLAPHLRIMPADYAFAIWAVIYPLLFCFCVWGFFPVAEPVVRRVGLAFTAANAFNSCWILLWIRETPTSAISSSVAIVLLLVSLLVIRQRVCWADSAKSKKSTLPVTALDLEASAQPQGPGGCAKVCKLLFCDVVFSVYSGWVTLATIIGIAVSIYCNGFEGGDNADYYAVAMIGVAAIVNMLVAVREHDPAFPLVFVWAAVAIAHKQSEHDVIVRTAYGCCIPVVLSSAYAIYVLVKKSCASASSEAAAPAYSRF